MAPVYFDGMPAEPAGSFPLGEAKGPGVPPTVTTTFTPDLIPVNANNDNWNPIGSTPTDKNPTNKFGHKQWISEERKFIPAIRDFNAQNLWQDDKQLTDVNIVVTGGYAGTLKVFSQETGGGQIRLWKDKKKTEPFVSLEVPVGQNFFGTVIYAEGKHESSKRFDIKINTTFTLNAIGGVVGGSVVVTDEDRVTVTPVVHDYSSNVPVSSMMFFNSNGVLGGMQARSATGGPGGNSAEGITFRAEVTPAQGARVSYVQNLDDVVNGTPAGMTTADSNGIASAYFTRARDGVVAEFPFLDTDPNKPDITDDPTYPLTEPGGFDAQNPQAPGSMIYRMTDSPRVVFNVNNNSVGSSVKSVDVEFRFRNHLVIRYDSDKSIYSLGLHDWVVRFKANIINGALSIDQTNGGVFVLVADPHNHVSPRKTIPPAPNGIFTWNTSL